MRYIVGVLVAILVVISLPISTNALSVTPTIPPDIDGPFIVSGYSFWGHSLRYVQITNTSNSVAKLDGWKVVTEWQGGSRVNFELYGSIAPMKKVIAADNLAVSGATFNYQEPLPLPSDARLATLRLQPPTGSGLNDVIVGSTINDSTGNNRTPRDDTATPSLFYFSRNISSSTGNYLSTFSAFVPGPGFALEADPLYSPAIESPLRIVELYPKPPTCSPFDESPLCVDFVKVINASADVVVLENFRIRTGGFNSPTSSNTALFPNNGLRSGEYIAIPLNLVDSGGWVWVEDTYGTVQYESTSINYPSATSFTGSAWSYNNKKDGWQWTTYPTPANVPNDFGPDITINTCNSLRLSEIAANTSNQFIEIYNAGDQVADLGGCALQTNRSTTANYIFGAGEVLAPGAYLSIPVASTPLTLTKTTTGTVYILNSNGQVEVDARSYDSLDENSSMALIGGSWMQTFTPTPGQANQYTKYLPCQVGYERNEETGMCRKVVAATIAAPCDVGQYRSVETNRCRSLTSATLTNSLTPCASNQYRSPETNRCKLLSSTASTLVPCSPGQTRSTETNRCRKDTSSAMPKADYALEKTSDSTSSSIGWLAFAGVGSLAAGYAGWEWRREAVGLSKKFVSLFTRP